MKVVHKDLFLVKGEFLLEKIPGKGGWTYILLPPVSMRSGMPFNWQRVKGRIDDFAIHHYHLMPVKGGGLFLPVRAAIRRSIGKKAGDRVFVELYPDTDPLPVPEALEICLDDSPGAKKAFYALPLGEQKRHIDHILAAKRMETRADRIARLILSLENQGSGA